MRSSGGVVSSGLQHSPPPAAAPAAGVAGSAGAACSAAGSSGAHACQAKAPMPAIITSVKSPVVILCTFCSLALAAVPSIVDWFSCRLSIGSVDDLMVIAPTVTQRYQGAAFSPTGLKLSYF